jgi:putative hydrolase of the HAD superfamily
MINFDPGNIKVIGFDADDTLWMNETLYRETERNFCELLSKYKSPEEINRQLFQVEIGNLDLYGYGSKAFTLSLVETAIIVSDGLGKAQISEKNPLLEGVHEVLRILASRYRLIVATKGDLLDQERKLKNSGIAGYFHHIEIMSDKKEENYLRLLEHLDVKPQEFLMIGNSMKSDILPVISLGGFAIHIPYRITWQHEELLPDEMPDNHFFSVEKLTGVPPLLGIYAGSEKIEI